MSNVNLTVEQRYKLGFVRNGTEKLRDAIDRCMDVVIEQEGIVIPPFKQTNN